MGVVYPNILCFWDFQSFWGTLRSKPHFFLPSFEQDSEVPNFQTLQAIVSHFQKLFDVPSLDGVYPRMNEVYTRLGEMHNAVRNLQELLELGDGLVIVIPT